MPGLQLLGPGLRNLRLSWALTRQDLRKRYSGSVLGLLWLLVYPAAYLALYVFVFSVILKVKAPALTQSDYVLSMFCGLVPFLAFTDGLSLGTGSIARNRNLIKNTLFPIELIPLKDVLVGHSAMGIGFVLVWLAVLLSGRFSAWHLLMPLFILLQIALCAGLVWIAATVNIFVRDLEKILPVLVIALMLISPIAYTIDFVPEQLRLVYLINPLAPIIESYRGILLYGTLQPTFVAIFAVESIVVFFAGLWFHNRLKPLLVEHV